MQLTDSFWSDEVGDFKGWEVVSAQVKEGRHIIKQYVDFLKQRSMVEDAFGKSLLKLSKSVILPQDIGCLNDIWDGLVSQTESSGYSHLESSRLLALEANRVYELSGKYREERKAREESVRQSQQKLRLDYKKFIDAKKTYENRCGEEISSNQTYHQEVAKKGKSSKEADKAQLKFDKATFALKCAELNYHSMAREAEESRQMWEKETEDCLRLFQTMEEERFDLIRDSLWRVSNFISAQCVADDNGSEDIRILLESTKFEDCLNDFIEENLTGSERPAKIVYKPLPTSNSDGLGHARQVVNGRSSLGRECNSAAATPSVMRAGGSMDFHSAKLERSLQSDQLPRKPPRLIHYASSTLTHERPPPPVSKSFNPASHFPLVDSVDNIEYFNLSDTNSPSSDSQASERSLHGYRGGGVGNNYPSSLSDQCPSLSDFRWPSNQYYTEKLC